MNSEEKLHLHIGFHAADNVVIEIPASLMTTENAEQFWPEIQRQLSKHFLECAERGELSPAISGCGPSPESRQLFEQLWAEAVSAQKVEKN